MKDKPAGLPLRFWAFFPFMRLLKCSVDVTAKPASLPLVLFEKALTLPRVLDRNHVGAGVPHGQVQAAQGGGGKAKQETYAGKKIVAMSGFCVFLADLVIRVCLL